MSLKVIKHCLQCKFPVKDPNEFCSFWCKYKWKRAKERKRIGEVKK
jgi:predicted nucleic acid-binding Zn ribbon protein